MPNIPEYTSQKGFQGLEPSDLGAAAYEGAARRVRGAFSEAGEAIGGAFNAYENSEAQQDTSALSAEYATTWAKLTQSANQSMAQADPNDPDAAKKWQDNVLAPALESFGQNANSRAGRELATRLRAQMEMDFTKKTLGDQSVLAGSAVTQNMTTAVNALGQAAYDDPTSFPDAIKNLDTILDAQISTHANSLTPEDTARLRTELVDNLHKQIAVAAVRGAADKSPAVAQQWLASGKFDRYFSGPEAAELNRYAGEQAKAQQSDAERQERLARQQADDASEAQANKILGSFVDPHTGALNIPKNARSAILADPTLKPTTKLSLMGTVDRISKPEEFHADPAVLNGLLTRTLLPPGSADSLTQAEVLSHVGKDISTSDYNFIVARMNAKTPMDTAERLLFNQTLTQAKAALAPSNMGIMADPQAQLHYSAFLGWFLPTYEAARKTKSAADLLDPHSPDYLLGKNASRLGQFGGTAESGFQATLQAVMGNQPKPAAAPAPKKPIGDFMKGLLGANP